MIMGLKPIMSSMGGTGKLFISDLETQLPFVKLGAMKNLIVTKICYTDYWSSDGKESW